MTYIKPKCVTLPQDVAQCTSDMYIYLFVLLNQFVCGTGSKCYLQQTQDNPLGEEI